MKQLTNNTFIEENCIKPPKKIYANNTVAKLFVSTWNFDALQHFTLWYKKIAICELRIVGRSRKKIIRNGSAIPT